MSEMWCWPHEFVQPEMLIRTPPTSARPGLVERAADVRREPARLRDREVAGVGAGAADDVAGELDARLVHVVLTQAIVELGQLLLGEAAQARSSDGW